MIIESTAYARAGLMGNPSDGYFGRTIAFAFREFCCRVTVFESPELRIEPHHSDRSEFSDIDDLIQSVRLTGYYGGVRLIKAAIVRFARYLRAQELSDFGRTFTIRYSTDIPQRVGLAGSSAIITAVFRALAEFFEVRIPWPVQANLVLATEKEELGIPAGLQDRVVQTYEGCVYMDFSRELMEDYGYGAYDYLDVDRLPPLYVAYKEELSEGTEVPHSNLRERFESGERQVREAMRRFAQMTHDFRLAMDAGDYRKMHGLINANFDLRASLMQISDANWELINAARNVGASAKFAGSGGAIVGSYRGETMCRELVEAMGEVGARVILPTIVPPHPPPVCEEDGEETDD